MSNKFIPHTEEDIAKMLGKIGVSSIDDLYADVPQEVIFRREYDIPSAMSEVELRKFFRSLGEKNRRLTVFAGGGVYDHYAPSVVNHLLQRSEFYTAYTPYQPEISQGTLTYIFDDTIAVGLGEDNACHIAGGKELFHGGKVRDAVFFRNYGDVYAVVVGISHNDVEHALWQCG